MIYNLFGFAIVLILLLFLVMTSFVIVELPNFPILYNKIYAISPVSFNSLECLDLILPKEGGKHPPQSTQGEKSPVLLGLNLIQ